MTQPPIRPFPRRRAFTLVELLVVIGIIALLIGILLPALNRARVIAKRTQDLSNIRQMGLAVANYAANSKGVYPIGTRGTSNDDMAWINDPLADYLLQFCNSGQVIFYNANPAANPGVTDVVQDPLLTRVLCCNAEFDDAAKFGMLHASSYTSNEVQLGWVYWGGRYDYSWSMYAQPATAAPYVPVVINTNGSVGDPYVLPFRQGDHPTTRTLFTCFSFMSPSFGGIIPHQVHGNGIAKTVNATSPYEFMSQIDGMCVAYTDGSARYAPGTDLGAIRSGGPGNSWYFYDKNAQ
jgi:prepilin-type N-terminal cleavage/methylation domain-containing protein